MESVLGVIDVGTGSMLQWGHGKNAVERSTGSTRQGSRGSCNGATAGMPWRGGQGRSDQRRLRAAMGPRPGMPWRVRLPDYTPDDYLLQWGHGGNAVERSIDAELQDTSNYELQWGHGERAVESGVAAAIPRRP